MELEKIRQGLQFGNLAMMMKPVPCEPNAVTGDNVKSAYYS